MTTSDPVSIARHLRSLRVQEPPPPWRRAKAHAMGGLLAVGYADNSDLLLVVSLQGRGVFDCRTGERIARDHDDSRTFMDDIRLTASGVGPLDKQVIRIAGISGGGLTTMTQDRWRIREEVLDWPLHSLFIEKPWMRQQDQPERYTKIADDSACELRAYGFSHTGLSFVVALSCELIIFNRT